jgi:hypothetical protein
MRRSRAATVERLSCLAFTAPAIAEAICQGRQPAEVNAEILLNRIDLQLEWPAQLKASLSAAESCTGDR